jgi:hypothetical protein
MFHQVLIYERNLPDDCLSKMVSLSDTGEMKACAFFPICAMHLSSLTDMTTNFVPAGLTLFYGHRTTLMSSAGAPSSTLVDSAIALAWMSRCSSEQTLLLQMWLSSFI